MIKVDESSGIPIYLQVVSGMKHEILAGIYGPDDRLPSIRELAVELKVNPNTIAKAYQEMETHGTLYYKRGQGAFVSPHTKEERMNESRKEIERLLREVLSIARTLEIPRDEILTIVRKQLDNGPEK